MPCFAVAAVYGGEPNILFPNFKFGNNTPEYADLYALRKETIERVFADAKEKHAMRYTFYRGLAQVSNWVRLKFAAMNLKKNGPP